MATASDAQMAVAGVPDPGDGVGGSGGFFGTSDLDGTVTVTCDPGPPAMRDRMRVFDTG